MNIVTNLVYHVSVAILSRRICEAQKTADVIISSHIFKTCVSQVFLSCSSHIDPNLMRPMVLSLDIQMFCLTRQEDFLCTSREVVFRTSPPV